MEEKTAQCVSTAKGPVSGQDAPRPAESAAQSGDGTRPSVRVGKEAPDFEAIAYVNGGFENVTLSNLRGKWVVLCFYPGDFTFV